ncbi:permease for cytosine/purines, uracil, thiamine, allantoin-domain-containing protein [Mycena leptocephala]|nr:permease for cytosine/purines, uracil, thiamine, allantoin-domain-containing protein [Mycena leptocephala]
MVSGKKDVTTYGIFTAWKPSTWALERSGPLTRSNEDMDPVPAHLRTWTTWNYVSYWISDMLNPTMQQALCAISFGHMIIAVVIVLNGTMGARLHVSFPVIARASFGFWLSYVCVLIRMALATFWFGIGAISTFNGSECTYQMLKAIWPSITHIPNHLPQSSGITTAGMACYCVFWLIQLPFLLALLVPITLVAMLTWAMIRTPPYLSLAKSGVLDGSASTWAWLGAFNSAIGAWSTLSVNIPDFTRYAINEKAQYLQIFIIPALVTLIGFCGIAVASASQVLYGSVIWDPLKIIDHWNSRPASFFASFSLALAVLATNIAANSISFANDASALAPGYVNIRRGQIICAVLGGWIICPWKILSSAPGFLNFMAGYSIFLGPGAAMCYWIIHRCKIEVDELYNPHGRYRYWNGINWTAAVAFLLGFLPNVPGLAASLDSKLHPNGMQDLFKIAWLYGFFSTSVAYWTLSALFPARESFFKAGGSKE